MTLAEQIRHACEHREPRVWFLMLQSLTRSQLLAVVAELFPGEVPPVRDVYLWAVRLVWSLVPEPAPYRSREWPESVAVTEPVACDAPVRSVERLVYHDEPGRHCCEWIEGDAK